MARRTDFQGARCLVTGASSGLGRAIGIELARAGASVILTGRSRLRLDETIDLIQQAGISTDAITRFPADLTLEADRLALSRFAYKHFGALDLLIQSAGIGANGPFETHDPSVLRTLMEVNFFALAEFCRDTLPILARGDRPTLVNLGSIVARRGLPGRTEYSASKFAVAGFTEALRAEWAKFGIHVLLLNPGFTATEFEANLAADTSRVKVTHRRRMTPQKVAIATLTAIKRGKSEVTLTPDGRFLLGLNRLTPRLVDRGFARWIRKKVYPDAVVPEIPNSFHTGD